MKIEIAVCDDEKRICQDIAERIKAQEPESHVMCFDSGKELLKHKEKLEIVFLDIKMQQENGMEIAGKLRKNPGILIIFVTAYKEHVFGAFDVGAFHYLLKPLEEEKFQQVLKRAVEEVEKRRQKQPLKIKEGNVYHFVKIEDIFFVESNGRKMVLHTREGIIEFYGRMQELQQQLGQDFFRCHRGYLVQLSKIVSYDAATIYLKNGESVYLSKQKYGEFVSAYMAYLRETIL